MSKHLSGIFVFKRKLFGALFLISNHLQISFLILSGLTFIPLEIVRKPTVSGGTGVN